MNDINGLHALFQFINDTQKYISGFYPLFFSQADQKKEEGNQLYKTKNYREALQRYSEAIGKYKYFLDHFRIYLVPSSNELF